MGIGATFFLPPAARRIRPRRAALRAVTASGRPRGSATAPAGPSLRKLTPYKKSDPRFFRRSDFSVIPVWWGARPHPTSMEFRIFSNISHCVLMPSPISGVRVSRIISSPVSIQ